MWLTQEKYVPSLTIGESGNVGVDDRVVHERNMYTRLLPQKVCSAGGERGAGVGKKFKVRKRHITVGTVGNLRRVGVVVQPANLQAWTVARWRLGVA